VLFVTHDQTEAMSLSDDLAVMREGRVLQLGAPIDVYRRPAHAFVAGFVGSPRMTLWRGRREGSDLSCRGVRVPLPAGLAAEDELQVGIRPEDVELSASPLGGGWPAERRVIESLGAAMLVRVAVGGEEARILTEPRDWPEALWMRWPAARLHWFAADGARIGTDEAGERGWR
jgi:ABC-type sugar transport system ATPase subunit